MREFLSQALTAAAENNKLGIASALTTTSVGVTGLLQLLQGTLSLIATLLGIALSAAILYLKILDIREKWETRREIKRKKEGKL
ncbi:MAG: hypothetical protein V4447_10590 [Pseudomonadota bacterium]